MARIVRSCFKLKSAAASDSPGDRRTIQNDEQLRKRFEEEVVLELQWIVEEAFEVKVQDIFAAPPPAQVTEESVSDHISDRLDLVGEGLCLHDGSPTPQACNPALSDAADKCMHQIQESNRQAFRDCTGLINGAAPVKIAILDTGADIPEDELTATYEGRLAEVRSWLTTQDAAGEKLPEAKYDSDGHGTHGTSVLLEATQYTDIKVYVAQIFEGRDQKITDTVIVDDPTVGRIVNAINHAVEIWQVDIISMSFGFPHEVPEIYAAMKNAQHHDVLMVAAASNCAGNGGRSWPASDERVVCVYAATGAGNKYEKNPTPQDDCPNFSFLGDTVEAWWPVPAAVGAGKHKRVRKSGTSTATPICAATAAVIISVLRRNKDLYIRYKQRSENDAKRLRIEYDLKLKALGSPGRIGKVLKMMSRKHSYEKRDGYHYVPPQRISITSEDDMLDMIKAIIQALSS